MKILNISTNNYINSYYKKSKAQQQTSPLLINNQIPFRASATIPADTYFVQMAAYKSDAEWAKKMTNVTQIISYMIKRKSDFLDVLFETETCIAKINSQNPNASYWGMKKTIDGDKGKAIISVNPDTRGHEYYQKYLDILQNKGINMTYSPKSNEEYKDAITCKIIAKDNIEISYQTNNPYETRSNLDLAERAYNSLLKKENPAKKDVVETAATIQWLIAQETPYVRGSDSIANLLTRSLMYGYDISLSPLKKGVSCDYEAFYRDLDDYIKIYPTLFEKNPLLSD